MRLADVKGVGDATLKKLKNLDVESTEQLINYLPKSYIDFNNPVSPSMAEDGKFSLFKVYIKKVGGLISTKGGLKFFSADAVDPADADNSLTKNKMKITWFNQPYLKTSVKPDTVYLCFGKAKINGNKTELNNPSIEPFDEAKKLRGVMPVYRTKGAVKQGTFKLLVEAALKTYSPNAIITDEVCEKNGLTPLAGAYRQAHFPQSIAEGREAQSRIALEDTVKEIIYYKILNQTSKNRRFFKYDEPTSAVEGFIKSLPYKLTESQQTALKEIFETLKSDVKMNRLLIGDVGSGKTVIALITMLYAVKCGYQTAIMAPTEILAQQHMRTAKKYFESLGLNIVYLSGSVKVAERKRVEEEISSGRANIVIGTHSIFQKKVNFKNLSLVVIDEQHKFGVAQKFNLQQKGVSVDTLTLTATPIPRSVLMLLYDELQLSQIDKNNINPVKTYIVSDNKKAGLFEYIRTEAKKGNQAFIVCPKIFDGEGVETYSATSLYKELKEGLFIDINVALIHGKLKAVEKNEIMQGFSDGRIDVLISTTVIEVGIDIKNATTIAVLNSERFGLATLHQLRGRVGRGEKRACCFLHTSDDGNDRLKALVQYDDGFKLAELDFALRGGGDYLGTRQSGDTDGGKYIVPLTPALIMQAKQIAVEDLLPRGITLSVDDYNYYAEKFKEITVS